MAAVYPAPRPAVGRTSMDLPPSPAPAPPPPPSQPSLAERQLRKKVGANERFIVWTRGWLSRDGRAHRMLAARTLDFAVLTDQRLYFFSTGFFTRLPRRRVYAVKLERLHVTGPPTPRGQRLRLDSPDHKPLRLELRGDERDSAFAHGLLSRTREARE
ncbi:MAG TPA: hypothetical protein VFR41_00820 [Acidimicrobiia bacterium]|nr:hypothetical protein [Acidimicrobiia bacterium]